MNHLYYIKNVKYMVWHKFSEQTPVKPECAAESIDGMVRVEPDGTITLSRFFPSDGATGVIDSEAFKRSFFIHDGFFKLFRDGVLDIKWLPVVNDFLETIYREDLAYLKKSSWWRRLIPLCIQNIRPKYCHIGVDLFSEGATKPSAERKILCAPPMQS